MKKIKKCISAFALVMAIAPISAFADTTITEEDTLPKTADSSVEFSVDPAYTVTIPATVTLEKGEGDIYGGSGTIEAESVFLNEGKEIVVSLTSASKFNMQTSETAEYKLPYTAEGAFGKLTDKEAGGIVAKFATSTTAQSTPVTYTTDEVPQYAGSYSDPVVFTLEVRDIVTEPTNG